MIIVILNKGCRNFFLERSSRNDALHVCKNWRLQIMERGSVLYWQQKMMRLEHRFDRHIIF